MSAAQTPCPTWCETDHTSGLEDGHTHTLGEYDHTHVSVYVWPSNPAPCIRLTNRRPLRNDPSGLTIADVEWGEAPALAGLMDTLGHREIGELIRDGVELIEDEAENGPVLAEVGARLSTPAERADASQCTCVRTCAEDPATACSLSGTWHVHPDDESGCFGPCPVHADAPGDLAGGDR